MIELLDNAYIIRTSWVYSSFGSNFVKTMLNLGKTIESLNVVADQIGSPTYARDLAATILNIIEQLDVKDEPGIYNYSNEGVCSWYDFASELMKLAQLECHVKPINTPECNTPQNSNHLLS
jgi:dTDP-4-dehydrorhamnose reductase